MVETHILTELDIETISTCDIFTGVTKEEIRDLLTGIMVFLLEKGETVHHEEHDGNCIYLIISGKICIYEDLDNQSSIPISLLERNNFFGNLKFIGGKNSKTFARAEEDTKLLKISYSKFMHSKRIPSTIRNKVILNIAENLIQ